MTFRAARLSALHAASFLALGIYLPFFPVWLQSRGLDASAIGVVLAIPIAVRVLATAPLVALADGSVGARRVLLASHAANAILFASLLLAPGPLAIGAIVAATAVAQAPIIPLNDLVTMQAVRERPKLQYGSIRVWGSVAFLVASVGGGVVSAAHPDVVVLLLAVLPTLGVAATLRALPRTAPSRPRSHDEEGTSRPFARGLWLIMVAAAFIQASHAALYGFGSLHWQALGFSEPAIGALWAFAVAAEIGCFAALGRIARTRTGALRLLALGASAAALRAGGLVFIESLAPSFAFQALHAFSFAGTHIATLSLVTELSPKGARGRAQGWTGTVVACAMALATVGSGFLYRPSDPLVFAAMAPLALAGLILTLAAARFVDRPARDAPFARE